MFTTRKTRFVLEISPRRKSPPMDRVTLDAAVRERFFSFLTDPAHAIPRPVWRVIDRFQLSSVPRRSRYHGSGAQTTTG